MKRVGAVILLVALAACGRDPPPDRSAGAGLERAAIAAGMIPDPAHAPLEGSWARDADRLCIVPVGGETRIGVVLDYGQGQGCAASGTLERDGTDLAVRFGDCRFRASFDGERIVFPADMPEACDRVCTGRATLAAMEVERLSASASEAATLRAPNGRLICADS